MDDPSGVTEHDKAVELMEMIRAIPTCAKSALPGLLLKVSRLGQVLEENTQDPEVLASKFMANVVSAPSEATVTKNWQILADSAPSLIASRLMDEYTYLLGECLARLIVYKQPQSGNVCEALMRLSDLNRTVSA